MVVWYQTMWYNFTYRTVYIGSCYRLKMELDGKIMTLDLQLQLALRVTLRGLARHSLIGSPEWQLRECNSLKTVKYSPYIPLIRLCMELLSMYMLTQQQPWKLFEDYKVDNPI